MKALLALFGANFAFIFLKAFQQRNVAFNNYIAVFPSSLLLATSEVFTVSQVAKSGWSISIVLTIGTAAGLGALSAMVLHNKFFTKEIP